MILAETWDKLNHATWTRGGWEIDGVMHWLAKDHPGTGGRVAWHVWADRGRPIPEHLIRCHFPEDGWHAVVGGELLAEKNCIKKREMCFCLASPEGDVVEIIGWQAERDEHERGERG